MPTDPAIRIEGLTVALGGLPRLDAVGLSVERSSFHGLIGPNGAGKSTLLRVLYRALEAQKGRVDVFGRPLSDFPRGEWAETLGALVQEGGSLQGLTVRDVVEIGCMGGAFTRDERAARVGDALRITGLEALASEQAALVSGGERQKTHMAQLFARDPAIYVLDEPTNHLDLRYQFLLLDEVVRRGKTVIATFHDIALAARYCDTITVLNAGRAVASGPPGDVLTASRLRDVFGVDATWTRGRLDVMGVWRG